MTTTYHALDYEIVARDQHYQVWTPDLSGACIGSGKTPELATRQAIVNMAQTIQLMAKHPALNSETLT